MPKPFSMGVIQKKALLLPLFLLGLAALTTLTTFLAQDQKPQTEALAQNSIYNNGPSGYKAWFLTAQKVGLPIQAWENSFEELDTLPVPSTMLIVKPFTVSGPNIVFGKNEASQLMAWVAKGNTLVLLDDFKRFGSNAMVRQLQFKTQQTITPQSIKTPQNPKAFPPKALTLSRMDKPLQTYIQAPILSQSHISLQSMAPSPMAAEAILTDRAGNPHLTSIAYRSGRLILGTTTDLAENQYLNQPRNDNYQFLTNLLKRENKPVYVNEFVHGYVANSDLFGYFQKKTPLGDIFAQLILFFCLLLWISFVRWTPKPQEQAEPSETLNWGGQTAYIQSLAGLYLKSKAPLLALEPQLKQLETTLRQRHRLGLEEDAHLQDLLTTLFADYSSIEDCPTRLLEALKLARQVVQEKTPLLPQDLLKISQQLTRIEERLRHGNRTFSNQR
ncbi:DUF4350 domain-containing protein [Vampirovibrio sp.]|uniref:DUF4350 domain-containing protein n=1 Tax=Vampirovibrio sp. TaxID=2717857 RepID=UPI003593F8B5